MKIEMGASLVATFSFLPNRIWERFHSNSFIERDAENVELNKLPKMGTVLFPKLN